MFSARPMMASVSFGKNIIYCPFCLLSIKVKHFEIIIKIYLFPRNCKSPFLNIFPNKNYFMRLLDCLSIYMFYLFSELFRILTFDRSIRRDVLPFLDFLFVLHLYSLLFLNIISELEIFFCSFH